MADGRMPRRDPYDRRYRGPIKPLLIAVALIAVIVAVFGMLS